MFCSRTAELVGHRAGWNESRPFVFVPDNVALKSDHTCSSSPNDDFLRSSMELLLAPVTTSLEVSWPLGRQFVISWFNLFI